MTDTALHHIAHEWGCEIQFTSILSSSDEQELVTFWHGDKPIFGLSIRNGEMPWKGYYLAQALHEKCKEVAP